MVDRACRRQFVLKIRGVKEEEEEKEEGVEVPLPAAITRA